MIDNLVRDLQVLWKADALIGKIWLNVMARRFGLSIAWSMARLMRAPHPCLTSLDEWGHGYVPRSVGRRVAVESCRAIGIEVS